MSRALPMLAAMAALAAASGPYIPPPRSVWSIVERPRKKSQKKRRRLARRRSKR